MRYSWPGNIRQLRNLTRQLVIASRGQPQLRVDPQLERELGSGVTPSGRPLRQVEAPEPVASAPEPVAPATEPEPRAAPRRKPTDITEQELLAAMEAHEWEPKAVADALGIPRPSIYDLINKHPHLRTAGDLSPEEITRCHHECGGDLDAMVRRLKVSKRALRRRINELGLDA